MPKTRSQKALEVKVKRETKPFAVKQEIKTENVKLEPKEEKPDVKQKLNKPAKQFDENGEPYWKLGRNRRLNVSKFKGVEYVHIRMFYTDEESGKTDKQIFCFFYIQLSFYCLSR